MTAPLTIALRTDLYEAAVLAALQNHPGYRVVAASDGDALLVLLAEAECLVISPGSYDGAIAEAVRVAPRLRHMHLLSSGRDRIDRFGPLPDTLTVSNSAAAIGPTVAEHAMALVLGLMRQLHGAERARARARWERERLVAGLRSLAGARLTLVGYGAIGAAVARMAAPFGCEIAVVRRAATIAAEGYRTRPLDEALPETDVLVLAVPLTPETRGLMDARRLALLPRGAIVVNVGRGGLIDTEALLAALRSGQVGAAGLDVFEQEPLPEAHPLWSEPNVILTPHLASFGHEGKGEEMGRCCLAALGARFGA
ncbi:MAG: NAD(P)-dependent oxidoreductase [Azospirillaceae bacterium]